MVTTVTSPFDRAAVPAHAAEEWVVAERTVEVRRQAR
jgi:hypothetical protein